MAMIQESLSVTHKTGALATRDLERVASCAASPPPIHRRMRRCAAVEPAIGHIRLTTAWAAITSKAATAARINAVRAAAGYNFRLLLRWLEPLLGALIEALLTTRRVPKLPKMPS